jgi:hypothetical protein
MKVTELFNTKLVTLSHVIALVVLEVLIASTDIGDVSGLITPDP